MRFRNRIIGAGAAFKLAGISLGAIRTINLLPVIRLARGIFRNARVVFIFTRHSTVNGLRITKVGPVIRYKPFGLERFHCFISLFDSDLLGIDDQTLVRSKSGMAGEAVA